MIERNTMGKEERKKISEERPNEKRQEWKKTSGGRPDEKRLDEKRQEWKKTSEGRPNEKRQEWQKTMGGSWMEKKKAGRRAWLSGSYTAEAALVVPIGFLVLLSLECLFLFLLQQNHIRLSMLKAVQAYSCSESTAFSAEALLQEHVLLQWEDTVDGKICHAESVNSIPFLGSRFVFLRQYQQMIASDYHGISMKPAAEGEEIVYVAENGKVYHLDRECTYLRTRIQATDVSQLDKKRNQSGGIYYPCESCCKGIKQQPGTEVYITSYGDRYHVRSDCSKLKRTVRAVPRSEAGGLPACTKCG